MNLLLKVISKSIMNGYRLIGTIFQTFNYVLPNHFGILIAKWRWLGGLFTLVRCTFFGKNKKSNVLFKGPSYPLMPADALNLINHMKLHVNGKIWKKGEREIDEKRRNKSPLSDQRTKNKKSIFFSWKYNKIWLRISMIFFSFL